LGELPESIARYTEALEYARRSEDRLIETVVWNNRAVDFRNLGELDRALSDMRSARDLETAGRDVLLGPVLTHLAFAQNSKSAADSGFSFDVYGDSRSMMSLPYKASQEADARKLMVDMFDLVMPEKRLHTSDHVGLRLHVAALVDVARLR